jgi:hypothetical protein
MKAALAAANDLTETKLVHSAYVQYIILYVQYYMYLLCNMLYIYLYDAACSYTVHMYCILYISM